MAVETLTTYVCDGCNQKMKERRELHRFRIVEQDMDNKEQASAKTELCTDCEVKLHEFLRPIMPEKEFAKIEGIIR